MTPGLIERLEAAGEGSRELDWEVDIASGYVPKSYVEIGGTYESWRAHTLGATRSLDAALALAERVLPGFKIAVVKDDGPEDGPKFRWSAQVARYSLSGPVGRGDWWFGVSDTPALALCIAILKARATQEQG